MAKSFVFVLLMLSVSVMAAPDAKYQCLRAAITIPSNMDDSRATYDINNALTMYSNLDTVTQDAIARCNLDTTNAVKRCQAANPNGACEVISPGVVQIKCDSRFKRVGSSHCAMNCPSTAWAEDQYHCTKPASSESLVYVNLLSCPGNCEEIAGRVVPICTEGLKRVSLNKCVAVCPLGWHDEGARCRKPAGYRLSQPFFWSIGDN